MVGRPHDMLTMPGGASFRSLSQRATNLNAGRGSRYLGYYVSDCDLHFILQTEVPQQTSRYV